MKAKHVECDESQQARINSIEMRRNHRGLRHGRSLLNPFELVGGRLRASGRDKPIRDDRGFGMRQIVPLGLMIGGIALSAFGLLFTLLILQARSRCEAGLQSCVTLGPFYPLLVASGIALGIAGALRFRRARREPTTRV